MKNLTELHHIREDIEGMNLAELEELENSIHAARLGIMVRKLQAAGFSAFCRKEIGGEEHVFNLILIYAPGEPTAELLNQWATLEEARHLLDFAANLPVAEAFRRWAETVAPFDDDKPYTKADAIRDTREARARLKADLDSGRINGEMYSEMYKTTSFMDLVAD